MKRILLVACLSLAILATACMRPVAIPNAETMVLDEKALYAAEASYNVTANAYIAASEVGLMTPELKAKIKPVMVSAYKALTMARSAYLVANAKSFYEQIAAAKQLSEDARLLIPRA